MFSERFGLVASGLGLALLLECAGCGRAAPNGDAQASQTASASTPNATPPTVAEAVKVIDLRTLPLVAGSENPGGRSVARLAYQAPCSPKAAYEFHQKQLVDAGWEISPHESITEESGSGSFTRDGFTVTLQASQVAGGDKPATMVFASNLGNLTLSTLPKPPNAEVLYDMPASLAYVTPDGVAAVSMAIDKDLQAAGWETYGTAGDTRFYRKNAVRLLATTATAPAQEGKTVVTYFTELLSAELPAPADAKAVQYSEPPVQLYVEYPGDLAAADKWYRESLGKLGWEPTLDHPTEQDFESFVIYRNKAGEMLEINFRPVDDFTRLTLKFTTAEEFAEMEKRWAEQKKKLEAERAAETDK
ncbi:hypothetical protein [Lacipirellula parvula]|uniref:Uncharacterized protein n=1 Tax=Lacipirellula parvula TaxID=2650471 RepID=A0A5K7XEH1_9BACT|nr:hypothetical protein [Lacipirellula parvula]BBO33271.1 hypothetical protein PLANPX_2883 [Lacipirellula parvula]